jgi:putative DNA primase/helicase
MARDAAGTGDIVTCDMREAHQGSNDTRHAPSVEQLIESGLALVPIPAHAKGPTMKGWNDPRRVVRTAARASMLMGRNVGLAHAYCTPTPTAALDLDDCRAAARWFRERGIELGPLVLAPDAVVISSGTPNRLKLLYRLPPGLPALPTKAISGPDGKMVLELRCATSAGKTVQDVIPPSVHPTGRRYQWLGQGDPREIPPLPSSLIDRWKSLLLPELDPAERSQRNRALFATRDETPREIATLKEMLAHVSADCDRSEWVNLVFSILSTGWKCAEEIAREWSMTTPHRFEEDAFQRVVADYQPERVVARTVGTIKFYARQGGWNG